MCKMSGIETKTAPKKLYKYQPDTEYAILNLKNKQFYFSHADDFNDPFDCNYKPIHFDTLPADAGNYMNLRYSAPYLIPAVVAIFKGTATDDQVRSLLDIAGPDLQLWRPQTDTYRSEADRKNLMALIVRKIIDLQDKLWQESIVQAQENLRKTKGVTCFSATNLDIRMWSHYADKHAGFCLEFDTKRDLAFDAAFEVLYQDYNPKVSHTKLKGHLQKQGLIVAQLMMGYKHSSWTHEEEWRVVYSKPKALYAYSKEALVGVYFGLKMLQERRNEIILILQENFGGHAPKFYEMIADRQSFKVEARQLESL